MDPRQLEALAQRLAANANDTDALNAAYAHGQADPRGYAVFLEKTAAATEDGPTAAHWYCEAAAVWTASMNDAHRAERALTKATERDPLHPGAVERLITLYREKANVKAVLTLHQRRIKALEKLVEDRPELAPNLAEIHAELGRMYVEELSQPDKAISSYQRAFEQNPEDVLSIYQARELLKSQGRHKEALPLFDAEIELVGADPARQVALYADQAEVCRQLGDTEALKHALRGARRVGDPDDPTLKQQLAAVVLEEVQSGKAVPQQDITEAEALFVSLAESYDGEYGHSYAVCALGLNPKNDRAAQLAMYYAEQVDKSLETATTIAGYLAANPEGLVAEQARELVARALSAGGGEDLIAALTPAESAAPEVKAAAFGLIGRSLLTQAKKADALHYFKKVVQFAPGEEEAVAMLADHYRGRDDRGLRDLLQAAARQDDVDPVLRQGWLKELAELCEGKLGDVEGAIFARHQLVLLDPSDDHAADQLEGILAAASKWDDLAELIARRAQVGGDPQTQIERELRVADIHLTKRKDRIAAAEALTRAARLEPDEQERAFSAVDLWTEAGKNDAAISLLIELLREILDSEARAAYNRRLADLLEQEGRWADAGGAFAEAASIAADQSLWAEAERCFKEGEAWEQAAVSVAEQQQLANDHTEKSKLSALRATYLERLGDDEGAIAALVGALELNPRHLEVSRKLERVYEARGQHEELVAVLLGRAETLHQPEDRAELRKRAAFIKRDQLRDEEGMRASLLLVLDDVEDRQVLEVLADDSESRGDSAAAIGFLRRLAEASDDDARIDIALRLSRLLEDAGDEEGALDQYELVLVHHPDRREVLAAVAQLRRALGNPNGAAEAYARLVELSDGDQKLSAARIWAEILAELGQKQAALGAYAVVLSLDAEDYEVVALARDLAEEAEQWEQFVKYQQELVDLEGDEDDGSEMVRKLSDVYETKLKRPKDAMRVLTPYVKQANVECREEFERIGLSLGSALESAKSIFSWMQELGASPARTAAIKSVYGVFVVSRADTEAIAAGLELVEGRHADEEIARSLETVGVRAKHLEALRSAFRVLGQDLSGPARAEEMVRQAEVLHEAGADPEEAVEHGEQSLSSANPDAVEPLLERLAQIAGTGEFAVSIYERQVARCKSAAERLAALCRAAEVAHDHGVDARVTQFLELAIQTAGSGEGLGDLRDRVAEMDLTKKRSVLREALVRTLADAGKNARDGGKSRAEYLALAASIGYEELKDEKQAYALMTQALIAHATDEYLDQLVQMAEEDRSLKKATDSIAIALEHVSDGPMVRLLLRRRFDLYAGALNDDEKATEDLKRLYELSPTDGEIASELEGRYETAGDHRGLVKLYEDQILRGRDKHERANLARKVALIWQDTLAEPREAADAWRRVLRMNSGDQEAKDGLERAKAGMRRVSAQEVIAGEELTRIEVEKQKALEEAEVKRRAAELEAKAAELKARHSQPPPPLDLEEEEPDAAPPETAMAEGNQAATASTETVDEPADDQSEPSWTDDAEPSAETAPTESGAALEDGDDEPTSDDTAADRLSADEGLAEEAAEAEHEAAEAEHEAAEAEHEEEVARVSVPPPLPPAALSGLDEESEYPTAAARLTAADLFDAEETPMVDDLVEELVDDAASDEPDEEAHAFETEDPTAVDEVIDEPNEPPIKVSLPPPLPPTPAGAAGSSLPPPLPPRGARPNPASGVQLPPPASLPPPPPPAGGPSRRPPPPPPGPKLAATSLAPSPGAAPPPPPGNVSRRPPPPPPAKKS